MLVDVTKEERDVLLRWKKRSDSFVLVRLKAEAVLYASRGVDVSIIAEMVDRSQRTVRNWLARWRLARLCSVVTGHAGNENAAKLTRSQKEQLKEILSRPPSQSGIKADFWDVPALRDVVKIKFGVEYASDSSYQLLMRFLGMSFKLPDPFDKRRDEAAITARMAQIRQEVAELLTQGWEVYTVDEVRVEHETHVAAQGRENQTPCRPHQIRPVILRRLEPDDKEDEDLPHRGQPERRADNPGHGPPCTRNRKRQDSRCSR